MMMPGSQRLGLYGGGYPEQPDDGHHQAAARAPQKVLLDVRAKELRPWVDMQRDKLHLAHVRAKVLQNSRWLTRQTKTRHTDTLRGHVA